MLVCQQTDYQVQVAQRMIVSKQAKNNPESESLIYSYTTGDIQVRRLILFQDTINC